MEKSIIVISISGLKGFFDAYDEEELIISESCLYTIFEKLVIKYGKNGFEVELMGKVNRWKVLWSLIKYANQ